MLTKNNIMRIIKSHEEEIAQLKTEMKYIPGERSREVIKNRIMYLEDNKYRHELQAKAWELL